MKTVWMKMMVACLAVYGAGALYAADYYGVRGKEPDQVIVAPMCDATASWNLNNSPGGERYLGGAICGCAPLAWAQILTYYGREGRIAENWTFEPVTNQVKFGVKKESGIATPESEVSRTTGSATATYTEDGETKTIEETWSGYTWGTDLVHAERLVYDIGVISGAWYGAEGGTLATPETKDAAKIDTQEEHDTSLSRFFELEGKGWFYALQRSSATVVEYWTEDFVEPLLRGSLQAGAPIKVGVNAYGSQGHAIVCDGYGLDSDGTAYFHLNLGWGDQGSPGWNANGWVPLSWFTRNFTGDEHDFTNMYINLQPEDVGCVIAGVVMEAGELKSGVEVLLKDAEGKVITKKTTSDTGAYAFTGLTEATPYTVKVGEEERTVTTGTFLSENRREKLQNEAANNKDENNQEVRIDYTHGHVIADFGRDEEPEVPSSVLAIWDSFEGLTEATNGLAPSVGVSRTQQTITLDGSKLTFHLGGGTVVDGVLSTGKAAAPYIDLAGEIDVGHGASGKNAFPISVLMAIKAPVSDAQLLKPFVHEGNGTSGLGINLRSATTLGGTWQNGSWTTASALEVKELATYQMLYLAFANTAGGVRLGVVDPVKRTASWRVINSGLHATNNLKATVITFGNLVNANADGMNFEMAAVALFAGAENSSTPVSTEDLLACIDRFQVPEVTAPTLTWAGTTTNMTNVGTWNTTETNWTAEGKAIAFTAGSEVVFKEIDGVTTATVTLGENVAPASILVECASTRYMLDAGTGFIQGGGVITKRGEGTLIFGKAGANGTDIAELVQEGGTIFVEDHALQKSDTFGAALTVKGGTLDMNDSRAWYTGTDQALWLTKSKITLGGSATAATIKNANIVPYTVVDFLEYVGGEGVPAATFAANIHSVYQNSVQDRLITVGKGAGEVYDLEISGTLGVSGGEFAGTTLVKKGEGTLKLSGENNFPALTIETGTVVIAHEKALTQTVNIHAGATLDLGGILEDGTSFAGAGTLANNGDTEVVLTQTQLSTFTGRIIGKIKVEVDLATVLMGGALTSFTIDAAHLSVKGEIPEYLSEFLTFNVTTGEVEETYAPLEYQIRWMPMGDSITEGEMFMGVATDAEGYVPRTDGRDGGYRYQLWKYLEIGKQDTLSVGYRSGHQGTDEAEANPDWAWHCGLYGGIINPISYAGAQAFNVETTYEHVGYPEVVTLMLGINDLSYIDNAGGSEADVYAAWTGLVNKLAQLRPHTKIVVSTLFPLTSTNESYARAPVFNAALRADAEAGTGPFANANVIFADVNKWAFNGEFYADCFKPTDGLHPNLKGSIRFGQAFRLGVLKALDAIRKDPMAITQVHNATAGKIAVRFNKPIKAFAQRGVLTLKGTNVKGESINYTLTAGALDEVDPYVISFSNAPTLIGGSYTATFEGEFTDALDVTHTIALSADGAKMDIVGSGAEENVAAEYLDGFKRISTITLTDNDNYAGTGPAAENVRSEALPMVPLSRVGYYVELKRPGKPTQFVWVSMEASVFGNDASKVGIPTTATGAHKAIVEDLSIYGNRGNFTKQITRGRGIIEFTPWSWAATEQSGYVNEARGGHFGWNDSLETAAGTLKGCMQVAHIFEERAGTWQEPAAETLFAFNNFNAETQTDLGIGSFAPMWNNNGSSKFNAMYDWTDFSSRSLYANFTPAAYEVKSIEIWVEEAEVEIASPAAPEVEEGETPLPPPTFSDDTIAAIKQVLDSTSEAQKVQKVSAVTLTMGGVTSSSHVASESVDTVKKVNDALAVFNGIAKLLVDEKNPTEATIDVAYEFDISSFTIDDNKVNVAAMVESANGAAAFAKNTVMRLYEVDLSTGSETEIDSKVDIAGKNECAFTDTPATRASAATRCFKMVIEKAP